MKPSWHPAHVLPVWAALAVVCFGVSSGGAAGPAQAVLREDGVFAAPGWRIEPDPGDTFTLSAFTPGGPGGREPAIWWTLHVHHGPYVSGPPRRTTRRFRRLFTVRDEAQGGACDLGHMADRRETQDVGCWVARCLQASGTGLRIQLQNRNGLLAADAANLTGGDSMGFSLTQLPGTLGDTYRVGDDLFRFPEPPLEPGRQETRQHTVPPGGVRLVCGGESAAAFTLWLGVGGTLTLGSRVDPDRNVTRTIEFSTGTPRLELWWAPGDATPPEPNPAPDGWLAGAVRLTLAGPAPARVQAARKAIDGLTRLAREKPGAQEEPRLRGLRQAFDEDVRAFDALLEKGAQPTAAWTLDDWIAIASLTARVEETRTELEAGLVMTLIL